MLGLEPQDVRLASVETKSTGPHPFFNVDVYSFRVPTDVVQGRRMSRKVQYTPPTRLLTSCVASASAV